jgi:hypothetical protein
MWTLVAQLSWQRRQVALLDCSLKLTALHAHDRKPELRLIELRALEICARTEFRRLSVSFRFNRSEQVIYLGADETNGSESETKAGAGGETHEIHSAPNLSRPTRNDANRFAVNRMDERLDPGPVSHGQRDSFAKFVQRCLRLDLPAVTIGNNGGVSHG